LIPGFSSTWRCPCGVTVDHTGSSFLEAWLRAVFLTSMALGAAATYVLSSRGVLASTAFSQLALLAVGMGLTLAAGLSIVVVPLAILVAKCLAIPFSPRDKIGAGAAALIALVSCLVLVVVMQEAIRTRIVSWPDADAIGKAKQAAFEIKK
jgi:ABC-type Mn2+/Zn2+ transport system permease subunit